MTHKALIRKLQISCLGLDPIDPLRLLVDDVVAALAQTEQEPVCPDCKAKVLYECVACSSNNYPPKTEQEPVAYWKEHAQGLQRDYDSLLAEFQAQPEQKLIGTVGDLFDDRVIAHRKLDRDLLVYIKERNT